MSTHLSKRTDLKVGDTFTSESGRRYRVLETSPEGYRVQRIEDEVAPRHRWLVTEKTWVTAASAEEAIDAAVNCRKGFEQDVEQQSAQLLVTCSCGEDMLMDTEHATCGNCGRELG